MKYFKPFLIILLLGCYLSIYGQEHVVPLYNNPYTKSNDNKTILNKKGLSLPFFDDFSYLGRYKLDTSFSKIYPFDTLWQEHYVFVNTTMGIMPPSLGVATFDGLNEQGNPYNPGSVDRANPSDTLTTQPIDLSTISLLDTTVYLSFFYQPEGNGDAPESEDSLSLYVKRYDGKWLPYWSMRGTSVYPFKYAIIRLNPSDSLFSSDFQFRFINTATHSGNLDHWHIDYVYLNKGRTKNDTAIKDQAFIYPPRSVLREYTAMPAKQIFRTPNLKNLFVVTNESLVGNLYNKEVFPNFRYEVTDLVSKKFFARITAQSSTTQQINAISNTNFSVVFRDSIKTDILTNPDSIILLIKNQIIPQLQNDTVPLNDIAFRKQTFSNYFAYDDGTAEKGYGLINAQAGKVALRFFMQAPDSLQGVAIHFNQSKDDISTRVFKIVVWQTISPPNQFVDPTKEKIIYKSGYVTPFYTNEYQGFHYYKFDAPIYVESGYFYIGWEQNESYLLNVGLDVNYIDLNGNKPNPHLFYNVESIWRPSNINFMPMIRPVTGVNPFLSADIPKQVNKFTFNLFPNPAHNSATIQFLQPISYEIIIMDLSGKEVLRELKIGTQTEIKLDNLSKGVYLLKATDTKRGVSNIQKLIIN